MCQWRQAAGYPQYQVSRDGDVVASESVPKDAHDCPTQRQTETGTMVCLLNQGSREWVAVATLVAEAFLGPRNGRQVRHIDGDSRNSRADNLEYVDDRTPTALWRPALAALSALALGVALGLVLA